MIVNLQACDAQLAERVIDFCSGLVYAIDGSIQPVERDVVLLAPRDVDLSGVALTGLRGTGFFNQV